MSSLAPGAALLVIGLAVLAALALTDRARRDGTPTEIAARRHLARGRWVAAVAGVATLCVCGALGGDLGRGLLVAPAAAGAVTMCLLAVGERTVPTQRAGVRTVSLTPRSQWRWVAAPARAVAAAALLALGIIFAWCASTATADDQGRGGRAVEWATNEGTETRSPWPGSFYSAPAIVALAVAALAFVVAMRGVAHRSQVNADVHAGVADGAARRHSSRILQGILLVTLGVTLTGVALAMSAATSHPAAGAPRWLALAHTGGLLGALVGIATVITGVLTAARR